MRTRVLLALLLIASPVPMGCIVGSNDFEPTATIVETVDDATSVATLDMPVATIAGAHTGAVPFIA